MNSGSGSGGSKVHDPSSIVAFWLKLLAVRLVQPSMGAGSGSIGSKIHESSSTVAFELKFLAVELVQPTIGSSSVLSISFSGTSSGPSSVNRFSIPRHPVKDDVNSKIANR